MHDNLESTARQWRELHPDDIDAALERKTAYELRNIVRALLQHPA